MSKYEKLKSCRNSLICFFGVGCAAIKLVDFVVCRGNSMHPTIQDGDFVIGQRLIWSSPGLCNYHRGDIVCAISPVEPEKTICKRLAYKPNDSIPSQYWLGKGKVPPGHCYLLGDNLQCSNDSRSFGSLPLGLVESRMVFRVWPLHRMGWLSNHWFFEKQD